MAALTVPYLPSGYLDIERIRDMTRATPFVFILGARQGAGKTYGVTTSIIRHGETPVIIRRTKDERVKFANDKLSPMQRIDRSIAGVNDSSITVLYHRDPDAENGLGAVFGYVIDLSTATKRGFSLDGFDSIMFDECVPERHAGGKADQSQAETFFNLLITLFGEDERYKSVEDHPKVWIIGNANAIDCGIFRTFGITKTIERMLSTGREVYISPQRALSIFLADAPANAAKRRQMPLMRVAEQSAVKDMAINNKFIYDDAGIRGWPLREFSALASFSGEYSSFTIWRHKGPSRPFIYVTRGAYPARYRMHNSKEAFVQLGRDTAYKSRTDFWWLVLHANSGSTAYYDSVSSKQWFLGMRK